MNRPSFNKPAQALHFRGGGGFKSLERELLSPFNYRISTYIFKKWIPFQRLIVEISRQPQHYWQPSSIGFCQRSMCEGRKPFSRQVLAFEGWFQVCRPLPDNSMTWMEVEGKVRKLDASYRMPHACVPYISQPQQQQKDKVWFNLPSHLETLHTYIKAPASSL